MGLGSVAAARRRTVSKLAAVCLIALVLLPFTAPFAVCDVSDLSNSAATHGHAFDDGKPTNDSVDHVIAFARLTVTFQVGPAVDGPVTPSTREISPIARILRI